MQLDHVLKCVPAPHKVVCTIWMYENKLLIWNIDCAIKKEKYKVNNMETEEKIWIQEEGNG